MTSNNDHKSVFTVCAYEVGLRIFGSSVHAKLVENYRKMSREPPNNKTHIWPDQLNLTIHKVS